MRRLTGLDPTRLTPPRPVKPAVETHPVVSWIGGEPLRLTVLRPGIAVCADPAVLAEVLDDADPRPELALPGRQYVQEIDFLLQRIETSEAGKRLIEFLGHAHPLPDPDGSYGGPEDWGAGINRRVLCRHRDSGTGGQGHTVTQRDLAGINVVIMQSTDGQPSQWGVDSDGARAMFDGRGAFSGVSFHPRLTLLFDDIAMAPEIVLAHELMHCAHALAGTMDDVGYDEEERLRIQKAAAAEGRRLFHEKYGTTVQLSMKNPGAVKVPETGKTETLQQRKDFYEATCEELLLRYSHPLPVAETERGLVVLRGVNWEEIRTHGSDVAMEWIDGVVQLHKGRRVSPSPAETRAERLAFDHHARTVVRASRKDADTLAALREAADTWHQRKRVRGVTEVALCRDLGYRHRIAYAALTRSERVIHLGVPRARIPHRVFAGAGTFVYQRDLSSLNALAEALSTADPAAANQVREYSRRLGDARLEDGLLVEQRVCGRTPGRPPTTSQPHWVNPETLPEDLRKQAGTLIRRARPKTPATGKPPTGPITDVYEAEPFGSPAAEGGAGFVAMVPAKVADHRKLLELARRYRDEGFGKIATAQQRFALVIGLNEGYEYGEKDAERAKRTARQQKIIKDFTADWEKESHRIPIGILSFLWCARSGHAGLSDQKTIPYGAIRQKIAESGLTQSFVQALYADGKGCDQIFLHTGDADVMSLRTAEKAPLFDAAAERLAAAGWPDLFSGGYRLPDDSDVRADIATRTDRAVRVAMAAVDPKTVYFPEPNTFIKVVEGVAGLEDGVGFGTGDQEGEALAKSLGKIRGEDGRVFDAECSVVTDGTRLVQRIEALPRTGPKSERLTAIRQSFTQSHARREEWKKRVLDPCGVDAQTAKNLLDIVFAVPDDSELERLAELAERDPTKFAEERQSRLKEALQEKKTGAALPKEYRIHIGKLANGTHHALLTSYIDAYPRLP
ncbi:type III secretion system effector protein [Streptomyces albireticuli]|uniref:hypothetical protein n=1 Tax=Streptomyces albireticuli TaxID=1940 RepID=UPI0036C92302